MPDRFCDWFLVVPGLLLALIVGAVVLRRPDLTVEPDVVCGPAWTPQGTEGLVLYWTGVCRITTYDSVGPLGGGPVTKSGHRVHPRLCAVDPAVIPLGSLIYIEGLGFFVAADCGGAVKGRHIDVFRVGGEDPSHPAYGEKPRRVWVWRIKKED